MDIQGKRVVVTGAASGIGKALVLAFHKHGASKVVSVDINKADADTTAKEVNGLAIEANVGDEQDIQRVEPKALNGWEALIYFAPMQELWAK